MAGIVALVCAGSVLAQPAPLVTDRPDQTESAIVVPPGSVQLEIGYTFLRDEIDDERLEVGSFPGALVRVGLQRRVELRIGWEGHVDEETRTADVVTSDISGFTDASIGAKISIAAERGARPETAVLFATSLPLGDDELTRDRFDPRFRFSMSHTISERIGLGYNVGLAFLSLPTELAGERPARSTTTRWPPASRSASAGAASSNCSATSRAAWTAVRVTVSTGASPT